MGREILQRTERLEENLRHFQMLPPAYQAASTPQLSVQTPPTPVSQDLCSCGWSKPTFNNPVSLSSRPELIAEPLQRRANGNPAFREVSFFAESQENSPPVI